MRSIDPWEPRLLLLVALVELSAATVQLVTALVQ